MSETSAYSGRLKAVAGLGQQVGRDNLSYDLISSGALAAWIADDGVQGLTSNPSIFFNAIRGDAAYQAALPALRASIADPEARFEALVQPDVRRACDLFAPLYAGSGGKAGFVSFEVSPRLAGKPMPICWHCWPRVFKLNASRKPHCNGCAGYNIDIPGVN